MNTIPTVQELRSNENPPTGQRRKRDRAHHALKTAAQREERLTKHRLTRRATKSEEQREVRRMRCQMSQIESESDEL